MNGKGDSTTKEIITFETYGDLSTDCSTSAILTSIGPFFLGLTGIPVSLRYLSKVLYVGPEVKVLVSILGSVFLATYTTKKLRINCERKLKEKYDIQ